MEEMNNTTESAENVENPGAEVLFDDATVQENNQPEEKQETNWFDSEDFKNKLSEFESAEDFLASLKQNEEPKVDEAKKEDANEAKEYNLEDYDLSDLGDDVDTDFAGTMAEFAKSKNVSPEVFKELATYQEQLLAERLAYENKEAEKTLKNSWGDKYHDNMAQIRNFLGGVVDERDKELYADWFDKSGMGNNLYFINLMHRISSQIGPDVFIAGTPGGGAKPLDGTILFDS